MKKILFLLLCLSFCFSPAHAKGIEVQKDGVGIYIFKIPINEFGDKIKPYTAGELKTVSEVFKDPELDLRLVVNGGFFNIKTGAAISNVVIDGKRVENIFNNLPAVESLNKQNRIEPILNRSELRILEKTDSNGNHIGGKLVFDIENHFTPPQKGLKIRHSLQAGPMLLPKLKLDEESFIKTQGRKTTELAADVLKRRERTIVGLKRVGFKGVLNKDYLYIIIFTKDNKVALNEARDYCLKLGLNKALALDGGASTSINFDDIEIYSAKNGERRVKTFLVIEK